MRLAPVETAYPPHHARVSPFPDPATHDDPIGRLPWASRERAAWTSDRGPQVLLVLGLISVVLFIIAVPLHDFGIVPSWAPLAVVAYGLALLLVLGVVAASRTVFGGSGPWIRRFERRAKPLVVDCSDIRHPDQTQADLLSIALPPARPDGERFDPDRAEHRQAARILYTARTRDGLALEDGRRLTVLVPVLEMRRGISKGKRVKTWVAVLRWLTGMADRRRAWLAAMAWAEQSRWQRARAALDQIDVDPALLAHLTASDVPAVQIALAIHEGRLDDVPLPDPTHADRVTTRNLVEARIELGDPRVDDWIADPDFGSILMWLADHRLAPQQWLALIAHPDLPVTALSAATMLRLPAPAPVDGARALLDHPAVAALTDLYWRDYIVRLVDRCLEQLSIAGDASDLPRMALWASVGAEQGMGRHYREVLTERLAAEGAD